MNRLYFCPFSFYIDGAGKKEENSAAQLQLYIAARSILFPSSSLASCASNTRIICCLPPIGAHVAVVHIPP